MSTNNGYKGVRTALVIPTLCRDRHFKKCLDSLKANSWAKYVDLYIGLDYPVKDSHRPGYERILKILEEDFSMFRSFHLYKRPSNFGAFKNAGDLIEKALQDCEQYIFSEDDNVFSENFLEYMLKALDYFRDDPDVISVSGYSHPLDFKIKKECNIFTQNAIFSQWGTGFWKEKTKIYKKEVMENLSLIRDYPVNIKKYKFSRYRWVDYVNCVAGVDPDDDNVRKLCPMFSHTTDIAMSVYIQIHGKYQAMPVISKVRNLGFDGSGEYCKEIKGTNTRKKRSDTYNYSVQQIDQAAGFEVCYDNGESREAVFKIIDHFVEPNLVMVLNAYIKYIANDLLGMKRLYRLRKLIKGIK